MTSLSSCIEVVIGQSHQPDFIYVAALRLDKMTITYKYRPIHSIKCLSCHFRLKCAYTYVYTNYIDGDIYATKVYYSMLTRAATENTEEASPWQRSIVATRDRQAAPHCLVRPMLSYQLDQPISNMAIIQPAPPIFDFI